MSEYFSGVTFPWQNVTPADDAVIRRAVLADSILSGCEFSYIGSTLTMTAGLLIICGRQMRHTAVQNWAVTGATSGYARLLLTIDTTKAATEDVFDQIDTTIEYAAAMDGFTDLQQDDINAAGTIYQIPLCLVSLGSSGISGIAAVLSGPAARAKLLASNWTENKQTVYVFGVSADFPIAVSADAEDDANFEVYIESGVRAVSKANGAVTFRCDDTPNRDLTVNIALRA